MVRHWFSLIAVLAGAVLVVAADASQSQERRLGRRWRRNADTYATTSPQASGPYYYDSAGRLMPGSPEVDAMAGTQNGGRSALYPPDSQGMRALPVRLEVRGPADAELWIDDAKTVHKGAVREFISPPVEPGRQYAYQIKVRWMENGAERERTGKVPVRPGQLVRVDVNQLAEKNQ